MKKIVLITLIFLQQTGVLFAFDHSRLKFGDIFFSDMESGQATAIKIATRSTFSHCGIIFEDDEKWYILEAVQPVRIVPFDDFLAAEKNDKLQIKRLKNADELFTPAVKKNFHLLANQVAGKNYDPYFDWSDEALYCSELVWKAYHRLLGIDLCKLRPLKDYFLNDPLVERTMRERYFDKIPYDQLMVSPQDIYDSPLLITVSFK